MRGTLHSRKCHGRDPDRDPAQERTLCIRHALDSAATGAVGREFGFSEHATNILQFGNFGGPDFFGPLYDTGAARSLSDGRRTARCSRR